MKRYDLPAGTDSSLNLVQCPTGEWVKLTDYKTSEAKVELLSAALEDLCNARVVEVSESFADVRMKCRQVLAFCQTAP